MKRFYTKFRVALMTFTLGLASIYFFNWFDNYWNEPRVNLPKVQSESPIVVLTKTRKEIFIGGTGSGGSAYNCGGGGSGGHNYIIEQTKNNKRVTNKKLYSSNENGRKSN